MQKFKRVQISKDVWLKSGLEEAIHIFLTGKDIDFTYEGMRIDFSQPTQKKYYTPDFPIKKSFRDRSHLRCVSFSKRSDC